MSSNSDNSSWYSVETEGQDVVLSTRVRLARNLADFLFTSKISEDDKMRINSLAYDAFKDSSEYSFFNLNEISSVGEILLKDKNILTEKKDIFPTSIAISEDEATTCIVNEADHIRIASFAAGLNTEIAMKNAYKLDEYLQSKLQFAASYEFGYLTSHIKDCGTGMKCSLRVFIPTIVLSGKFDAVVSLVQEKQHCIKSVFPPSDLADFSNFIFDIFPGSACNGSELDQLISIQALGELILKTERKIRCEFADNNPTVVLNFVNKAYAKAMFSLLIGYDEAVDIIATIKWGVQSGIIEGIDEIELNSMFYLIKQGYLLYLKDKLSASFSDDVAKDKNLQIQKLRAIYIQQAFEKIKFNR